MIDELLELACSALAALSTVLLGFFFPCNPCCGGCGVADDKPRTDPVDEGTWVPSGTWRGVGGVTWSFTANPGDDSGETWFFYGSASTSKVGGGATIAERRDWGNICNWYSNKTTSPSISSGLPAAFDKRATRLPPETAVVHVYSSVIAGTQLVKYIYFWGFGTSHTADGPLLFASSITATGFAHDSNGGAVFNNTTSNRSNAIVNGGAVFNDNAANILNGIVNDGAVFNDNARNDTSAIVNGGAVFNDNGGNGSFIFAGTASLSVVNGGAVFNDNAENIDFAIVNGGAVFNDTAANILNAVVNDGAVFNDNAENTDSAVVNDGAVFNGSAENTDSAVVNDGAVFNGSATNSDFAIVNGGATFNDAAENRLTGTVNGGATFNDAACSRRTTGNFFATPCTRKFVAHPTDLPVCNGTAPDGCANAADTCGCG